jgi:hypothetical protein
MDRSVLDIDLEIAAELSGDRLRAIPGVTLSVETARVRLMPTDKPGLKALGLLAIGGNQRLPKILCRDGADLGPHRQKICPASPDRHSARRHIAAPSGSPPSPSAA